MSNNGFNIDLNRISKRDFRAYLVGRDQAEDKDLWDAEMLYEKVIISWPYDEPVTVEGYQNLGLTDALAVDNAVSEALQQLGKKKLEA